MLEFKIIWQNYTRMSTTFCEKYEFGEISFTTQIGTWNQNLTIKINFMALVGWLVGEFVHSINRPNP